MLDALSRWLRPSQFNYIRLVLLVAMLFTLLAALIFRTTGVVFMAALLWATHPMGTLVGRFMRRRLTVTRDAPVTGMAGDIVSGRLRVLNTASTPAFLVHLRAGEVTNSSAKTASATDTRSAADDIGDGDIGDTLPEAVCDEKRAWPIVLLDEAEHVVPFLQPNERAEWTLRWKLQRRGVHRLPPARAGACDPLGMFSALEAKTAPHAITVLPRPLRLERLGFAGGGQSSPRAPQHSAAVAEALDFHGIRAWQPGQPIRRVHWKSTTRTGELHVVEWEETLGSDLAVLLDVRIAAEDAAALDEALEASITLTASVAAHLLESGHYFQMFCWQPAPAAPAPGASDASTPGIQLCHRQARKAGEIEEVLKALAELQALPSARLSSEATLSRLARQAAPALGRSGVLLIAPTTADITEAVAALGASTTAQSYVRGPRVHVLALDAASFASSDSDGSGSSDDLDGIAFPNDAKDFNGQADSPGRTRRNDFDFNDFDVYASGAVTRIVRRGDSLAAALERE